MKINDNDKNRIDKILEHELALAKRNLAKGQDTDQILEQLCYRLLQKLKHPIIKDIQQQAAGNYNNQKDLDNYQKNYINKVGPVADHVDENLFDRNNKK